MNDQEETFAPLTSSKHTLAQYKNPFGFSLQVVQASEDIILGASGVDIAHVLIFDSRIFRQTHFSTVTTSASVDRRRSINGQSSRFSPHVRESGPSLTQQCCLCSILRCSHRHQGS